MSVRLLHMLPHRTAAGRTLKPTLLMCMLLVAVACDVASTPTEGVRPQLTPRAEIATPAVNDLVMGPLSVVARHVVVGLQNRAVRNEVKAALMASSTLGQVDLQNCTGGTPTAHLLRSGEFYGAGSADAMCSTIRKYKGLVLFMDRQHLQAWNPSVVPIITAIANPEGGVPATFRGYRSATRLIDLDAHNVERYGPVLIVFPALHPGRTRSAPALMTTRGVSVSLPGATP